MFMLITCNIKPNIPVVLGTLSPLGILHVLEGLVGQDYQMDQLVPENKNNNN